MQDIESKAAFSQQQLQIVKAQMAAKQRDIRLLQLTAEELNLLPPNTRTYEGVGKMYVIRGKGVCCFHWTAIPPTTAVRCSAALHSPLPTIHSTAPPSAHTRTSERCAG
jgi:hypothetical protein